MVRSNSKVGTTPYRNSRQTFRQPICRYFLDTANTCKQTYAGKHTCNICSWKLKTMHAENDTLSANVHTYTRNVGCDRWQRWMARRFRGTIFLWKEAIYYAEKRHKYKRWYRVSVTQCEINNDMELFVSLKKWMRGKWGWFVRICFPNEITLNQIGVQSFGCFTC